MSPGQVLGGNIGVAVGALVVLWFVCYIFIWLFAFIHGEVDQGY